MRVLLLEDEYSLRVSIEEFLEELNYRVDSFSSSKDALESIYSKSYDLFLLDVKVIGVNGFELLKIAREDGYRTPAIFITSLTATDDLANGYKSGCCDYIRKPFDLTELQFRIAQAIKSNCLKSDKSIIELPYGFSYDTNSFLLKYEESEIQLTKTERDIIEVLIKNRSSVVTIEMFQDFVWGDYIDPANIRVQINKLRKKLSKDLIKNVRGLGYKIDF